MKLYKSWLLAATCTIILVVTTYATTIQATKQKQEEVNLQQVTVSPSRSLKYGEKTTKKIPNQEVLFLPTSPTTDKNETNSYRTLTVEKQQHLSRNQPRSRINRIELATTNQANVQISRLYDNVAQQNQLNVQNNSELVNKPITKTVHRQRTAISNQTRSTNTVVTKTEQQQQLQPQPTQYSNLNIESEKNISITKPTATTTTYKSHKRKPTRTFVTTTNTNEPALSTHNSNQIRTHHPTRSNSTITRHNHSTQRNNNNNNNSLSRTQQLLASSHAVANTNGLQSKSVISSNRQTGNTSDNQSITSKITKDIRTRVRKLPSNASTITIISSTSTSTTTTPRPQFQFPISFNIFTPEFWQFLSPTSSIIPKIIAASSTTTTTRKPPKKYKPPTPISTKEEKLSLIKPKPTKQPDFDNNYNNKNNSTAKRDEGPFRIALPTFNILSSKRETHNEVEKGKRNAEKEINLRERFDCPRESEVRFQLFPKICKIDDDCKVWNREEICCDIFGAKSCVSGIPKPLEETSHAPILGVIPRKCPNRPLAELWWEVKECENDMDCWPRVCCPDGRKRYCRTSQPELDTVPVPVQRSFNYLSEYLECTPPPPPIFDLHPKPCTSTFDCFPNVCCQEAGLRHCRPPKKSVLTMLANVFNVDFVKRLTQNIVIK